MNFRSLESFAQTARRQLMEQVGARLEYVLRTDSIVLRETTRAVELLKAEVARRGRAAVVDEVAYTWFNRFCALRYMDINGYTSSGVVSPLEGHTQPELLLEAKQGLIDEALPVDRARVAGLLNGTLPSAEPQAEAYRLLLVAECNRLHAQMPFLFETISDYSELLMPDDLLSEHAVLHAVREALTAESCRDVEVIGWLYQYYISEKKDAVMARKGAVPTEDIPAVTQLFTPHWIVRYMVENSLGRMWLLNHPDSRIGALMDYYIAPDGQGESGQWSVASGQRGGESGQRGSGQWSVDSGQRSGDLATDHYPLITSPEELRLCDPACGSGHILTYAFDLLYAIYEETGYDPVQIPRLILEKNLTGIEIDKRAGALAGFALMMKAREKDRRFFRRGVQPDICVLEDVAFTPQELAAYMKAVGRDLFTQDVRDWLQQFEQATTFGSLIRPLVTDMGFIRARLAETGVFDDLFLSHTHDRVRTVLRMTDALSPRYHVVVANPPYMGSKGQNAELKRFAKDAYPDSKRDLCTMFIERNLDLVMPKGVVGMITMMSWMFLSSFEKLRGHILANETIETMAHLGARAFDSIGGEVVSTTTFTLRRAAAPGYKGHYFRLIDGNSEAEKAQMLEDCLRASNQQPTANSYFAAATDFKKIPGAPIAYWVSDRVREVFEEGQPLDTVTKTAKGFATGDNSRFFRYWFEVSPKNTRYDCFSRQESRLLGEKWYPLNKGGAFRRWYGNNEVLVDWHNDGYAIRNFRGESGRLRSRPQNLQYSFKQALTWSKITSGKFSTRLCAGGFLFDDAGAICHSSDLGVLGAAIGILNSVLGNYFLKILNPTLNYQIGDVSRVPIVFPAAGAQTRVVQLVDDLVAGARIDWDSRETSWDFTVPSLLCVRQKPHRALNDVPDRGAITLVQGLGDCQSAACTGVLEVAYKAVRVGWQLLTKRARSFEEENNRIVLEAYGLQDELSSEVPLSEITLTCNPHYRYPDSSRRVRTDEERETLLLADTMREFVSYAVGCMFGRYSLDKPGLILANQGETVADYRRVVSGQWAVDRGQSEITFMPDENNVIPMLGGEWFPEDVTERFGQFLRVTFGDAHYEENLAFIEAALGRDIRSYFRRDFYKNHVKMYKKRPIYWCFSSPKGSFSALIYMHRIQSDTVSVVLRTLRDYQAKLHAHREQLRQVERSAGAAKRERTRATKALGDLGKVLTELKAYEDDVLYPLAARQPAIDLDDGVVVNYAKFGKALRKI